MKVISLFSGAGGLDLGFEKAGHKIVFANDIFTDAVKTYEKNFKFKPDPRNISRIKTKEIPSGAILIAGFPCQGFSIANRGRFLNDPRNKLYKYILRIAKAKKVKVMVLENVKGLLNFCNGKYFEKIKKDIEKLDYRVIDQVLNAADYGVPQMRQRLILLCVHRSFKKKISFPPQKTHCDPKVAYKLNLQPWRTIGDALKHFPDPKKFNKIPNHQASKYKLRFNGHLGHRYIKPSHPAPTITARGDERGGVVVIHHPSNKRRITAREAAAIQSFPDSFIFLGSKTSAYRQIANSVPPLLGYALGKCIPK